MASKRRLRRLQERQPKSPDIDPYAKDIEEEVKRGVNPEDGRDYEQEEKDEQWADSQAYEEYAHVFGWQ